MGRSWMGTIMQTNPQYGYNVPGSHPSPYGCSLANGSLAIHYHITWNLGVNALWLANSLCYPWYLKGTLRACLPCCVILRTYDREGTALPYPAASKYSLLERLLKSRETLSKENKQAKKKIKKAPVVMNCSHSWSHWNIPGDENKDFLLLLLHPIEEALAIPVSTPELWQECYRETKAKDH